VQWDEERDKLKEATRAQNKWLERHEYEGIDQVGLEMVDKATFYAYADPISSIKEASDKLEE